MLVEPCGNLLQRHQASVSKPLYKGNLRNTRLSSGLSSSFHLNADALSNEDLITAAYLIFTKVGTFHHVIGIPTGGSRIANALKSHCKKLPKDDSEQITLVVDDVWTTGNSLISLANRVQSPVKLAVLFVRCYQPPQNVTWIMHCPLPSLKRNEKWDNPELNAKNPMSYDDMADAYGPLYIELPW